MQLPTYLQQIVRQEKGTGIDLIICSKEISEKEGIDVISKIGVFKIGID